MGEALRDQGGAREVGQDNGREGGRLSSTESDEEVKPISQSPVSKQSLPDPTSPRDFATSQDRDELGADVPNRDITPVVGRKQIKFIKDLLTKGVPAFVSSVKAMTEQQRHNVRAATRELLKTGQLGDLAVRAEAALKALRGVAEKPAAEEAIGGGDNRLVDMVRQRLSEAKTPRERINVLFDELKGILEDTEQTAFGYRLTYDDASKVETAKYLDYLMRVEMRLREQMSDKQQSAVSEMSVKAFRAFKQRYNEDVTDVAEKVGAGGTAKNNAMSTKEPRTLFKPQWHEGFLAALEKVKQAVAAGGSFARAAGSVQIPISRTPVVLRAVQELAGNKPFKRGSELTVGTGATVYLKGVNEHDVSKHKGKVSYETLKKLPELLADPIAIFKSAADSMNPDSYMVLIDATSDTGLPVVVAVEPQVVIKERSGDTAAFQASIIPVTWGELRSLSRAGNLRYYNEKSPASLGPVQPQGEGGFPQHARQDFDASIGVSAYKGKVLTRSEVAALPESAWSAQSPVSKSSLPSDKEQADVITRIATLLGEAVTKDKVKLVKDLKDGMTLISGQVKFDADGALELMQIALKNGSTERPWRYLRRQLLNQLVLRNI